MNLTYSRTMMIVERESMIERWWTQDILRGPEAGNTRELIAIRIEDMIRGTTIVEMTAESQSIIEGEMLMIAGENTGILDLRNCTSQGALTSIGDIKEVRAVKERVRIHQGVVQEVRAETAREAVVAVVSDLVPEVMGTLDTSNIKSVT